MQKKQLGNSGVMLPPMILGGNVFGWSVEPSTAFEILDTALEAGLNAIDTADVYSRWLPGHSGGESESIIGDWLKSRGNRDKVIIATKCGMDMGPEKNGLSKARIAAAVEESLLRLRTDYIDLYQAHCDDEATPLEETLEGFAVLIKQGKVRAIGASNFSPARLAQSLEVSKAHNLPRYESLQPLYNLLDRAAFEDELEQLCLTENIGVINYYSLAAGFLSGKYSAGDKITGTARSDAVQPYLNEKGFAVVEALRAQAERLQATPTQVAIAWVAARPSITAPISSATSLKQLNDLVKAAQLKLDPEAVKALNDVSK